MADLPPQPEEPQDLPWPEEAAVPEDGAEAEQAAAPLARPATAPTAPPRQTPSLAVREPLADVQAERLLLSAVLLNNQIFFEIADRVAPADFSLQAHRYIWKTIVHLMHEHQQVTPADLITELRKQGVLEEVGGEAFLYDLTFVADRSASAPHYAQLVADYSLRRQLLAAAQEMVRLVHRADLEAEQVLEEAERLLFRISSRRYRREVLPLEQVLEALRERLAQLREREDLAGIPTGFQHLDSKLKGLQPSDLIIVAGRPGMGKTAFLVTLALRAAQHHGKRVAIFSLEMSNEQVAQRMLSQETGLGADLFRDPRRLRGPLWEQLSEAMTYLQQLPIYLDDTPALTPQQLRVKCMRLAQQHKLDLVIVDYLQLMSGGRSRGENRVQEVSYISRMLKHLARDLNVPVVAAAQLSRAVEQRPDKRPILADLRESGALEQDADVVLFLYREEYYKRKEAEQKGEAQGSRRAPRQPERLEIIIAKHRNGPTGTVEVFFEPWRAGFREALVPPTEAQIDLNEFQRPTTLPRATSEGLVDEDLPGF